MKSKLSMFVFYIFVSFSALANSEIRNIADIDKDFFNQTSSKYYVFDDGSFASGCNEFYLKFKSQGRPSFNGGSLNSSASSSALSECLIWKQFNITRIDVASKAVDESIVNKIPSLLPADFLLAISDDSVKARALQANAKLRLQEVDKTILFLKKDGENYLFKDGVGTYYYFGFLGSFEHAGGERLYIVRVENTLEGGSYNSSRYFVLKKNQNGSFDVERKIEVF